MKDWTERYANKVTTPEKAVKSIQRGRRIFIGSGAAEPNHLIEALISHGDHLADNEIVHLLTLGKAPYTEPGLQKRFRHTAFFIGPNVREAVQQGRADFMPVFLSEIPQLIRSRRVRVDVALIEVTPPDRNGYCSLGVSVDIVRAAVDCADLVIAEVNPRQPRTLGNSFIHVSQIAHMIAVDDELSELETGPLDEVSREIGRHVASLVPNGATLQTGIGKIPHAVVEALKDHRDLGVHTEMLSDSVIDLVEGGVVNGRKKTLLPGKIVTSFVMGSRRLYDWVDDNPVIEMRPSEFTNDPFVVARNDNMIAINSALGVDLTGQVASDTLMGKFFSGIGGQVDFIRGAARSNGGKPIIALPSTAKDGQKSRIQAAFEAGAGVVTSRGDVHYVVTEYGIADLWGKSIRQRALALIDIAHPDFRAELLEGAKQKKYCFPDQIASRIVYPWEDECTATIAGDVQVRVRPVRISDEEKLQELFYRLSDESTYSRFMQYKKAHPHEEIQQLVDLDYERNMALVVTADDETEQIIAMARYDLEPATNLADIAFVVLDAWQGKGIGTLLMKRMAEIGEKRGVGGFTADVLASNRAMLGVFQRSGLRMQTHLESGTYELTLRFKDERELVSSPHSVHL